MNMSSMLGILICMVLPGFSAPANANTHGFVSGPYVEHPVQNPTHNRSGSVWKSHVGAWGEKLAEESLRLRGFNEIHEIKIGGNNGIDRIAIKRGSDGNIMDVKFVEVKTSRSGKPTLSDTRYGGRQMSRKWLASNLSRMRHSGDPAIRKLALELSRFRKVSGKPIEALGEIIHVNTATGMLTGYTTDELAEKYSQSIERILKNLQARGGRKSRDWATKIISQWDQIQSESMSSWLSNGVSAQSRQEALSQLKSPTRTAISSQLRNSLTTRILKRSAGRIAVVVSFAMDAKEIFDTEYAFRRGLISVRQRNILLATTAGGMGGAYAGASAGFLAGGWVGSFGGPFVWITVPAGAIFGAAIGGVGGYSGGSAALHYGASVWYDSIDASVRDKFERSLLLGPGIGQ